MDVPESQENLNVLRTRFPRIEILPISALQKTGLDTLKDKIRGLLVRS